METQRNASETAAPASRTRGDVTAAYCPAILSFVAENVLYPPHAHDSFEIFYVTKGTGIIYLAGHCLRVRKGDLAFASARVAHGYAMDAGSEALMTGADTRVARMFADYADQSGLDHLIVRGVSPGSRLSDTLWYMAQNPQRMKDGFHLVNSLNSVLDCLVELVESMGCVGDRLPPSRLDELGLAAYVNIVKDHASSADVALGLGMSPTRFSRTFRQLMGISFPAYRALARVNGARRMLAQTDLSVSEIAHACGYESLRSFNRQFLSVAGLAPTAYRERQAPTEVVDFSTVRHERGLRRRFGELLDECPRPSYIELEAVPRKTWLRA